MLVLSRHVGEEIMLEGDIRITVCEVRGDKVRLGISAPRKLQVHRKEVWERINARTSKIEEPDPAEVEQLKF